MATVSNRLLLRWTTLLCVSNKKKITGRQKTKSSWETLKIQTTFPCLMLQNRISLSPSQEQMRSSLFGWKSSDITDAECPVNVRIEQPCCKNQFHGINYEIQKTEKQLNAILCCNYSFEENKGRHLICSQMFRIIMHDAHHLLTPFHIKEQMLWAFTKYNHEQDC